MRSASVLAAAVVVLAAAPGAAASDAGLRRELARGVAHIRTTDARPRLVAQLTATARRLRNETASTAAGRRGRGLALDGFAATLRGLQAQLDLVRNDSGNIERATRDAVRAERALGRGARLLRAAGRALGVRVGALNGR